MTRRPLVTVILAAGKGTRMKSEKPKVLHAIGGRSMLGHVLAVTEQLGAQSTAVVIGPEMEAVRDEALRQAPGAGIWIQSAQDGTARAVLTARDALAGHSGDVLVLYADTPLLTADTLERMRARLDEGAGIVVLGFEAVDPAGYGRLLIDESGWLGAIREDKDASDGERCIRLCNSGVMAFRVDDLPALLDRVGNNNAKGEFYLTDVVEIASKNGLRAAVVECTEDEVLGVNARNQLAEAEAIFQNRARLSAMRDGATLIAPETVWFSYDTKIGRDVVVEPNVFFGPGVSVEDGVEIKANCYIEGTRIGRGARIGPFARLRPGADVGLKAHIGNFVEIKNAVIGVGAKVNHLTYMGDADVGAGANIGAGTIACNYDGFFKHRTQIGNNAFVGSNSSLVAPVTIGDGAYIGSGSVITKNVSADALALERSAQEERTGWAAKFRAIMTRRKAKAG